MPSKGVATSLHGRAVPPARVKRGGGLEAGLGVACHGGCVRGDATAHASLRRRATTKEPRAR